MFGLELQSWEHIVIGSLLTASAAAVVLFISSACVIFLQRQEVRRSNERIAELEAQTAEDQSAIARAELYREQAKWPRRLSNTEIAKLGEALKPFPAPYDLLLSNSIEPDSNLVRDIVRALKVAGWELRSMQGDMQKTFLDAATTIEVRGPPPQGQHTLEGIAVGIEPGFVGIQIAFEMPSLRKSAIELYSALSDIDWDRRMSDRDKGMPPLSPNPPVEQPTQENMAPDTIHIVIGAKR